MSHDPAHLETLFEPLEFDTSPLSDSVDHDPLEPSRCPYAPPYEELVSPLEPAFANIDLQEGHPSLPVDCDPVSPLDPAFKPFLSADLPLGPASGSYAAGDPSATDGCVTDQEPNFRREELAREEDPDRLWGSGKNRRRLQRLGGWVRKQVSTKSPTSGTL